MNEEEAAEFAAWKAAKPQPQWPDDYMRADTPSGWTLKPGWRERER